MQIDRTRGDTTPDTMSLTNSKTRAVVNITGCTFKMTLSTVPDPVDESTQVYQLTGTIVNAEKGVVEFAPTKTQADKVGYFYYDIQMTDTLGRDLTLVKDTYLFIQDITK